MLTEDVVAGSYMVSVTRFDSGITGWSESLAFEASRGKFDPDDVTDTLTHPLVIKISEMHETAISIFCVLMVVLKPLSDAKKIVSR